MPPVLLGVISCIPLIIAYTLRRPLEKRWVYLAPDKNQPSHQFWLDLALFTAAGVLAALFYIVAYGVPTATGIKMVVGYMFIGFFLSLNMALVRERAVIYRTIKQSSTHSPPRQLYSITHKFTLITITAAMCVAVIIVLVIAGDFNWIAGIAVTPEKVTSALRSVMLEVIFIIAVMLALVLNLTFSYSKNLKILFMNETEILEKVSRGDLSHLVPVATDDEFGVIAGHTNQMIESLRHRIQLLSALKLAEEVQQNLLPKKAPAYPGVDISGFSRYCDETGGDYYDFLPLPGNRLGVLVADAAGHGIGAALHMVTTRSFFHAQLDTYEGGDRLLGRVNTSLTRAGQDTGRFTTLFFLEIDSTRKQLSWIRAGHEPAILYEPRQDTFSTLRGPGIALGVDENYAFSPSFLEHWIPGSVIVILTDGIKEALNPARQMFDLNRLHAVVRQYASQSAEIIREKVIAAVNAFRDGQPLEDDITLVVVKLL